MKAKRVSAGQYREAGLVFRTAFECPEFNLLNERKCDELHFVIFGDAEPRFGIIGGVKDGIFNAPFSAPYVSFSPAKGKSHLSGIYEAIASLRSYCREASLARIRCTLPPLCYDDGYNAEIANALYAAGFRLSNVDLNHHYDLCNYTPEYGVTLDSKAAQKLRSAMKNGLSFTAGNSVELFREAYEVIRINRQEKGYPLRLSLQEVLDTTKVVEAEAFMVRDAGGKAAAASICFHTTKGAAQVIYWGNMPGSENLKPMNYLAAKLFEHYHARGFSLVDIGPSSESSIANFGLADFKKSVGCCATVKLTFSCQCCGGE